MLLFVLLLNLRINRNILECKELSIYNRNKITKVLIETYWNVKFVFVWLPSEVFFVLIETYWNVKTVSKNCVPEHGRINRNILECKGEYDGHRHTWTYSINRNILECKDFILFQKFLKFVVLIETYWNVKFYSLMQSAPGCKVLIETYWNVKSVSPSRFCASEIVLIETYWNVKTNRNEYSRGSPSINRNILECKVKFGINFW